MYNEDIADWLERTENQSDKKAKQQKLTKEESYGNTMKIYGRKSSNQGGDTVCLFQEERASGTKWRTARKKAESSENTLFSLFICHYLVILAKQEELR